MVGRSNRNLRERGDQASRRSFNTAVACVLCEAPDRLTRPAGFTHGDIDAAMNAVAEATQQVPLDSPTDDESGDEVNLSGQCRPLPPPTMLAAYAHSAPWALFLVNIIPNCL
jgi:hypothetical protein